VQRNLAAKHLGKPLTYVKAQTGAFHAAVFSTLNIGEGLKQP
jgi:hypothetical protein